MRRRQLILFLLIAASVLTVAGCRNPAEGKPEAEVSEAVEAETPTAEGARYVFSEESTLSFTGSKVTGSHEGGFNSFDGEIVLVGDDASASRVLVEIDTTSLWADDDRLSGHLKSPDFFDVEAFPTATFESTSIVAGPEGHQVTGNLTLHGISRSIAFPATITAGGGSVTADAEFFIQRFDFDMVYPGKADDLIRDEVVIRLHLVAVPES